MNRSQSAGDRTAYDVVIVGAGIAGLYMLHRVRGLGLSARVFEAAADVGGTWYWNRYPGARVDVESMEYSYSFSEELEQEWEWTERYASQPELLRYINHVADRFDLRRDIAFETRVNSAIFDEDTARWTVTTNHGDALTARFCITASGFLSVPKEIDIEGIESFEGTVYHTSRWPHEPVSFAGERVGFVGTGSSAIQAIPLVAQQAEHLTVFQRTANYAVPLRNGPLDPDYVKAAKAQYRDWRRREWRTFGGTILAGGVPLEPQTKAAMNVTAEERQAEYEFRYQSGGLCLYNSFVDLLVSKEANETAAEFVRQKIRERVKDPATAELLTPRGFPILTKRLCAETNYFETYNRDNVTLVDIKTTPISRVTPDGLRVGDTDYTFDTLIFATGFDALTGALNRIDIRGRGGLPLKQKWAAGPRTYLGLMTAGFPNLFNVGGPGSTASLTSAICCEEQLIDTVARIIEHVLKTDAELIEPAIEAEDRWTAHIAEVADQTLFPLANSWYLGANVPGKPRVALMDVGGFHNFIDRCDRVIANDFEGFVLSKARAKDLA